MMGANKTNKKCVLLSSLSNGLEQLTKTWTQTNVLSKDLLAFKWTVHPKIVSSFIHPYVISCIVFYIETNQRDIQNVTNLFECIKNSCLVFHRRKTTIQGSVQVSEFIFGGELSFWKINFSVEVESNCCFVVVWFNVWQSQFLLILSDPFTCTVYT